MSHPADILREMVARKGSSRTLTFSAPHVLKAIRTMFDQKYTSRQALCGNLHVGEGAARTLALRLRQAGLVDIIRAGIFLTPAGRRLAEELFQAIPSQCPVGPCSVANKKRNHAILLRGYAARVDNGIDQRDYAIMYGASGATTLTFGNGTFTFPNETTDCLSDDPHTADKLRKELKPRDGDTIIIASADDPFVAEIAAINSALRTLQTRV